MRPKKAPFFKSLLTCKTIFYKTKQPQLYLVECKVEEIVFRDYSIMTSRQGDGGWGWVVRPSVRPQENNNIPWYTNKTSN